MKVFAVTLSMGLATLLAGATGRAAAVTKPAAAPDDPHPPAVSAAGVVDPDGERDPLIDMGATSGLTLDAYADSLDYDVSYDDAVAARYDDGYDPQAYQQFDAALAPYGTWVDDPDYGHIWLPSAAEVGSDFTPYATNGDWLDTEYGWTWSSGWSGLGAVATAAGSAPDRGWAWVPGTLWGPAWCRGVPAADTWVGRRCRPGRVLGVTDRRSLPLALHVPDGAWSQPRPVPVAASGPQRVHAHQRRREHAPAARRRQPRSGERRPAAGGARRRAAGPAGSSGQRRAALLAAHRVSIPRGRAGVRSPLDALGSDRAVPTRPSAARPCRTVAFAGGAAGPAGGYARGGDWSPGRWRGGSGEAPAWRGHRPRGQRR